eukprot:5891393-Prymnesium_polylepis.1
MPGRGSVRAAYADACTCDDACPRSARDAARRLLVATYSRSRPGSSVRVQRTLGVLRAEAAYVPRAVAPGRKRKVSTQPPQKRWCGVVGPPRLSSLCTYGGVS